MHLIGYLIIHYVNSIVDAIFEFYKLTETRELIIYINTSTYNSKKLNDILHYHVVARYES